MRRLRRFGTRRPPRRHQGAHRKAPEPHHVAQRPARRPERADLWQRHHRDDAGLRRQLHHHLQGQQERGEERRAGHRRPDAQRSAAGRGARSGQRPLLLDGDGRRPDRPAAGQIRRTGSRERPHPRGVGRRTGLLDRQRRAAERRHRASDRGQRRRKLSVPGHRPRRQRQPVADARQRGGRHAAHSAGAQPHALDGDQYHGGRCVRPDDGQIHAARRTCRRRAGRHRRSRGHRSRARQGTAADRRHVPGRIQRGTPDRSGLRHAGAYGAAPGLLRKGYERPHRDPDGRRAGAVRRRRQRRHGRTTDERRADERHRPEGRRPVDAYR